MAKKISLKRYIKNLNDGKAIFGLAFDMPKEILDLNLIVRDIHILDIKYNGNGQVIKGTLDIIVEPIDENQPIPDIEQ